MCGGATSNYPASTQFTNQYSAGGFIKLVGSLPTQTYNANTEIFIRAKVISPGTISAGRVKLVFTGQTPTHIKISQDPAPTGNNNITSSGVNTLWGYPDTTKTFAITSSNPGLTDFYGGDFKMDSNVGPASSSGFNTIDLPWSLEIGDEFRFEGNEFNTFMVKKVYDQTETDANRISQTGSLEVQFDKSISSASLDLDHFLIRRYVPDASQIIIKGFKPINSDGPYILKPNYVTPQLNKGIDKYIIDLTGKGLL